MSKQTKLFISYHDEDTQIKEKLIEHLSSLNNGGRLEILDRKDNLGSIDSEEKEKEKQITSSDLVYILISASHVSNNHIEIEKILKEKKKSQIIGSLARSFAIDKKTKLSKIKIFPNKEEPIQISQTNINEEILAKISTYLRSRISEFHDTTQTLSFKEVKKNLRVLLLENNIGKVIFLLKELVSKSKTLKLRDLQKIESDYIKNNQIFSFYNINNKEQPNLKYDDWIKEDKKIKIDLETFILELKGKYIVEEWEDIFFKIFDSGSNKTFNYFISPADKINLPELEQEQQQKFKRLFYRCQDAYAVEKFKEAYDYCIEIKNSIEPESAQLYEYLLLNYVRHETSEKIIADAISQEGQTDGLNHVILYASRFIEFQSYKKCFSYTGDKNLQEIANILSETLKKEYSNIRFNYLFDKKDKDDKKRIRVRRCMEVALKIYKYIQPSIGFLEIAVNELGGGGKFDWIEVNRYFRLRNKNDFDAVNLFEEIDFLIKNDEQAREVEESDRSSVLEKILLTKLKRKYQNIKKNFFNDKKTSIEIRKAMIGCINAFKTGYAKYKNKEFLEIPINEIRGNGILSWFVFDELGDLKENSECVPFEFESRNQLMVMIQLYDDGKYNWEEEELKLIETSLQDLSREANFIYKSAKRKKGESNTETRINLIKCLRKWKICFKVSKEKKYLNDSINELIGNGILLWFTFKYEELANLSKCEEYGYNPISELNYLKSFSPDISINEIRQSISDNIFIRFILLEYNSIPSRVEDYRGILSILISQSISCYKFYPEERYLDFVFDELTLDKKFIWFDIEQEGIISSSKNINLFPMLQETIECSQNKAKINIENFNRIIASRKYSALVQFYNYEISQFKSKNNKQDRSVVIEIIKKCQFIYKVFPNPEYLKIPKVELTGNGRIKWFWKLFWIFPFNHPENKEINFNYKYELEKVYNLESR